jgi:hypothetical protein
LISNPIGSGYAVSLRTTSLGKKKEIKEGSNKDENRDEDTEKNEGPRLLQIG